MGEVRIIQINPTDRCKRKPCDYTWVLQQSVGRNLIGESVPDTGGLI